MDQRVKNLESLCELLGKQVLEQNNNLITMNRNLISEIKGLRDAYLKQNEDFAEFRRILAKIYEQNNQQPSISLTRPPFYQPVPVNNTHYGQFPDPSSSVLSNLGAFSRQPPPSYSAATAQVSVQQPQQVTTLPNISIKPAVPSTPQFPQQATSHLQKPGFSFGLPSPAQNALPSVNTVKPTVPAENTQQHKFSFGLPQDVPKTIPLASSQPLFGQQTKPSGPNAQPAAIFKPPEQKETAQKSSFFAQLVPLSSQTVSMSLNTNTSAPSKPFFGSSSTNGSVVTFKAPEPVKFESLTKSNDDDHEEAEVQGHPEEFESHIEFTPIVELNQVDVKTGEENEILISLHRCKLFRFDMDAKEWKEKGVGDLKLLKHKQTSAYRILMRREQVLKVCANHKLNEDMKLTELSPKQLSWHAVDYADNVSKSELLAASFKTPEETAAFKAQFEQAVMAPRSSSKLGESKQPPKPNNFFEQLKAPQVPTSNPNCLEAQEACFGKSDSNSKPIFTFGAQPGQALLAAPKFDFTAKDPSTTPLFAQPAQVKQGEQTKPAFTFNFGQSSTAKHPSPAATEVPKNPANNTSQTDAPASTSEPATREENEVAIFQQRCKLFRFENNEWKEKGTGEMTILKAKSNANVYRVLMRREIGLTLCANHRLTPELKFEIVNEKQVQWKAQDYSDVEGKHELLLARFRSDKEASSFKLECENAQRLVQSDTITLPSPKPSTSTSPAKKDRSSENSKAQADFKSLFDSLKTETPTSNAKVSFFGSNPVLSFNDLAKNVAPFSFRASAPNGQPTSTKNLFASSAYLTEIDEETLANPEEFEPSVDFRPLVKLEAVEVKTGEEDENVLVSIRSKCFRFHSGSNDWKEKGVGELKLLQHKHKANSYRVLMRRDQILKVCANFKVTRELELETINEKQLRIFVNDCSDSTPSPEYLAFRFRSEEEATRFRAEFQRVQSGQATKDADEVVFLDEIKPTDEQVKRARQFMLPDSFYLYENRPPCKGCRGCEVDALAQ